MVALQRTRGEANVRIKSARRSLEVQPDGGGSSSEANGQSILYSTRSSSSSSRTRDGSKLQHRQLRTILLHIIGPGVPQMDGQDEAQVFQTCPPQSVPCVQVGAAGSGAAPPEHSEPKADRTPRRSFTSTEPLPSISAAGSVPP